MKALEKGPLTSVPVEAKIWPVLHLLITAPHKVDAAELQKMEDLLFELGGFLSFSCPHFICHIFSCESMSLCQHNHMLRSFFLCLSSFHLSRFQL